MINGQYVGYADSLSENESRYDPTLTEDEEMPATERDLADDAPWKQIQKNTFTRWANEHLKKIGKTITNLETDLSDGLKLIALIEILSQKHVGKYNKRPNFRQMKLENVAMALRFLERERIKLVSIDAAAIVDGHLKLILGLIWTLILHYSISMPMYDPDMDEDDWNKQTPKQRLLGWIQQKVPQLPISNFNKDWHDGRALGALVDGCAPGVCPQWEGWDPSNKLENATEAMNLADEHLGIAQIITPAEITNPHVDEHSVMTYLSQFPHAQLKPGVEIKKKPKCEPQNVRAYGPGLERTGLTVEDEAPFTIDCTQAGEGEVLVHLTAPGGHQLELHPQPAGKGVYNCTYFPQEAGVYHIHVLFGGKEIPGSVFMVQVDDLPPDPSKVMARGPGLEATGVVAGEPTYFEVFIAGAGGTGDELETEIIDEGLRRQLRPQVQKVGEGHFRVVYQPVSGGHHTVHISYNLLRKSQKVISNCLLS
jgi:filamin